MTARKEQFASLPADRIGGQVTVRYALAVLAERLGCEQEDESSLSAMVRRMAAVEEWWLADVASDVKRVLARIDAAIPSLARSASPVLSKEWYTAIEASKLLRHPTNPDKPYSRHTILKMCREVRVKCRIEDGPRGKRHMIHRSEVERLMQLLAIGDWPPPVIAGVPSEHSSK